MSGHTCGFREPEMVLGHIYRIGDMGLLVGGIEAAVAGYGVVWGIQKI